MEEFEESQPSEPKQLRLLYVGTDSLVWNLLVVAPFVIGERAECGADGSCPIGPESGSASGTFSCDAVLVDDPPGQAKPDDVVRWLKRTAPDLPVILLSRQDPGGHEGAGVGKEADDVVAKTGVYRSRLLMALRRAHRLDALSQENAALTARSAWLHQVVEDLSECVIVLGPVGTVRAANHAGLRLLGAETLSDVLDKPVTTWVDDDQHDELTAAVADAVSGRPREFTIQLKRRLMPRPIHVWLEPFRPAAPAQPGAIVRAFSQTRHGSQPETRDRREEIEALRKAGEEAAASHREEREKWDANRRELESSIAAVRERVREAAADHERDRELWETARGTLEKQRADAEAASVSAIGERQRLQTELAEPRERWESARQDLERRVAELDTKRRALEARIAELEAAAAAAEETNGELTSERDGLRAELDAATAAQDDQRRERETAGAAWEAERQTLDAARRELESRLGSVSTAREDVERRLAEADAAREDLETRVAAADATRHDLDGRIAELQSGHERLTQELNSRTEQWDADRAGLLADVDRLASALARLTDCQLFGHAVTSLDGRLIRCNERFARLFGYADADDAVARMVGTRFPGLAGTAEIDVEDPAALPRVRTGDCLTAADGRELYVAQWTGRLPASATEPTQLEHVFVDLTPEAVREERLRSAKRLGQLGTLTGLMIPDLEALVTSVGETARQLASTAPGTEAARELGRKIEGDATSVTGLVQQLAAFGRRQQRAPDRMVLNEGIDRVAGTLQLLSGPDVTLTMALGSPVIVITTQDDLEQLLTSLVIRARDLLPGGGRVTIATGPPDALEQPAGAGLRPLRPVRLHVTAEGYQVQPAVVTPSIERVVTRCDGVLRLHQPDSRRVTFEVDLPTVCPDRSA